METAEGICLERNPYLDLGKSFNCGQAFRFEPEADGYAGVVGDLVLRIREEPDRYVFRGLDTARFESVVRPFLDLDRTTPQPNARFSAILSLRRRRSMGGGYGSPGRIRSETLITFYLFSK